MVENADSGRVFSLPPLRRWKPLLSLVKTEVGWKVLHWLTVIVELSADACNDPRELLSRARAYIRGTRRQRATVKVKSWLCVLFLDWMS